MAGDGRWGRIVDQATKVVKVVVDAAGSKRSDSGSSGSSRRRSKPGSSGGGRSGSDRPSDHSGTGGIAVGYEPERDGDADPGEVVWAWVAYEDDPNQGKDRPVLILGHDGAKLAGVPLSSKDHDGRRDERDWVPVGSGAWDSRGRPSYADASRLLRLSPSAVRREGAALDRDRFDAVIERVERIHDWHR